MAWREAQQSLGRERMGPPAAPSVMSSARSSVGIEEGSGVRLFPRSAVAVHPHPTAVAESPQPRGFQAGVSAFAPSSSLAFVQPGAIRRFAPTRGLFMNLGVEQMRTYGVLSGREHSVLDRREHSVLNRRIHTASTSEAQAKAWALQHLSESLRC